MAQDVRKGRQTEIEFMNGFIANKGRQLGIKTPTHSRIVELVLRVERGEVKPSAQILG